MNKQFGQYLTIEQLHSGPFGTVYKARHAKARGEFAVKHFNPDPVLASRDQIRQALLDFIERAQLQQRIGAARGRCWSAVHELVTGEGGYCVFSFYPSSVRRVIQTRCEITGPELYSIINGILDALSELRQICNRAHGNLKPENVLLSRKRKGTEFAAALSDAAADWQLGSGTDAERRDLRSIGQIIHDLVVPDPRSVHHAGPSPRWESLGVAGEGWRSLCNDLIAEDADRMLANLEELKKRVAQLGEHYRTRSISLTKIAAVVALVTIAAGIAAAVPILKKAGYWPLRRSTLVADSGRSMNPRTGNPNPSSQPATAPSQSASQPPQTQPRADQIVSIVTTTQPDSPATAPVVDPATRPVVIADPQKEKMQETQPDLGPQRKELTEAAARVRTLLDQGYSIQPEPGAGQSPLISAIDRYNAAKAALPAGDVHQISGDVEDRLNQIASFSQIHDIQKLLDAVATSDHLETALLGWRSLATTAWPSEGDPFPKITEAESRLLSLVNRISDSERTSALSQEIVRSLPKLWQSRVRTALSTDSIDGAIKIASRFGVPTEEINSLKAARPQRRQAEFRATIDRLRAANVLSAQEYNAAKSGIDSARPLMEPNPGRRQMLAEMEKANPGGATFWQTAQACFPNLTVYRWLITARANAAIGASSKERAQEFTIVALAFAHSGYWSDAAETVGGVDASPAKVAGYCQLAVIEFRAGNAASAKELLAQASSMASQFSNLDRISAYIEVAKAEAGAGMKPEATHSIGQAKSAAARIADSDAKTKAMETICAAQASIGDAAAALVTASSFSSNLEKSAIARRLIVCAQADGGNIDGARAGLLNIRIAAEKSVAQLHIAAAQAKAGDYAAATSTAAAIEARPEKCLAFLSIARAQLVAGDQTGAQSSLGSAILNLAPGPDTDKWGLYIESARIQAKLGKIAAAQSNASAIAYLPDRASAYSAIAEAQAAAGDLPGAQSTLELAARLIAGASEPHRASALGKLAQTQIRLGNWSAALQTLEVARNLVAGAPGSQDDDADDPQLVGAQAMAGDWDRLNTLAATREAPAKIRILTSAASAMASMKSVPAKG